MGGYGLLIVLGWGACSVLVYGITLAFFQQNFKLIAEKSYWEDVGLAAFLSIFGPLALVVAFFLSGFAHYGLQYRRRV